MTTATKALSTLLLHRAVDAQQPKHRPLHGSSPPMTMINRSRSVGNRQSNFQVPSEQLPVAFTCMRSTWAYADIEIEMSTCSQVCVHLWKSAHACASGESMRGLIWWRDAKSSRFPLMRFVWETSAPKVSRIGTHVQLQICTLDLAGSGMRIRLLIGGNPECGYSGKKVL